MFGSNVVEVGIGLVLMYFLLSLICSAVTEIIARCVDMRAKTLAEGIRTLLESGKAAEFFKHPLIARLRSREQSAAAKTTAVRALNRAGARAAEAGTSALPYYISPKDFSLVVLDLLAPADPSGTPKTFADIAASLANLPDGDLKRSLSALLNEAQGDLKALREGIERWFNATMDSVQGWYRRKAQWITLGVAFVVVICANADTLTTANMLTRDAAFRSTVVAAAAKIVETPADAATSEATSSTQKIRELQSSLNTLGYPIGWVKRVPAPAAGSGAAAEQPVEDPRTVPNTPTGWLMKFVGLILTTLLVSLGAPFWFDMLNKLVNLRAAGKPPETDKKPETTDLTELAREGAVVVVRGR